MNKEKALERLTAIELESKNLRKIIEDSDKPKSIMERCKTLQDCCIETKQDYYTFMKSIDGLSVNTQAYEKIKLICEALNEGTVVKGGYTPYFDQNKSLGSGFFYSDDRWHHVNSSGISSRQKLKTSELAKYAGKQFEEVYYDYIMK